MYRLLGGKVEAVEFIIKKECKFTNVPLKDLPTKANYLIACIGRKRGYYSKWRGSSGSRRQRNRDYQRSYHQ